MSTPINIKIIRELIGVLCIVFGYLYFMYLMLFHTMFLIISIAVIAIILLSFGDIIDTFYRSNQAEPIIVDRSSMFPIVADFYDQVFAQMRHEIQSAQDDYDCARFLSDLGRVVIVFELLYIVNTYYSIVRIPLSFEINPIIGLVIGTGLYNAGNYWTDAKKFELHILDLAKLNAFNEYLSYFEHVKDDDKINFDKTYFDNFEFIYMKFMLSTNG